MQYIIDVALIAVFVLSVVFAVKKGFFLSLFDLVVYIIAMVSAKLISAETAPEIFNKYFSEAARTQLVRQLGDAANVDYSEKIQSALDSIPQSLDGLLELIGIDRQAISAQVSASELNGENLVDSLMEKVVSPIGTAIIQTVVFIAVSLILTIILKIAVKLLNGAIKKLPAIKQVNSTLGSVLGAVKGALVVVLVSLVVCVIASATKSERFIDGVNNSVIINAIQGFLNSISGNVF